MKASNDTEEEKAIFSSVPKGETEGESECRASVSAEGGALRTGHSSLGEAGTTPRCVTRESQPVFLFERAVRGGESLIEWRCWF
jgi:hypothetical protein